MVNRDKPPQRPGDEKRPLSAFFPTRHRRPNSLFNQVSQRHHAGSTAPGAVRRSSLMPPVPSHCHGPPALCLSPLRRGCCAGLHAELADRRRLPTNGAISHVVVSKHVDDLPLYHQCQIHGRGGMDLNRSTLANWRGVSAHHITPVVGPMRRHIKRSGRLFITRPAP